MRLDTLDAGAVGHFLNEPTISLKSVLFTRTETNFGVNFAVLTNLVRLCDG